jgi:Dyp-type peroxidase family
MPNDDILDNTTPIDIQNPGEYLALLENLQGNIISDHGRNLANHIFVTFTGQPNAVKQWIRSFEPQVTSAWKQHENAVEYQKDKKKYSSLPFVSFFLSAAGYEYLGLKDKMPSEVQGTSFSNGMRMSREELADLPASAWDDPNWKKLAKPDAAVHGMILVANDQDNRLGEDTERILHNLKGIADCFVEKGKMYYQDDDEKKPLEHFGYVDGISNPLFLKDDLENADGYQPDGSGWRFSHWDPFAPLRLALVRDPGGPAEEPCFGSFLVFRKLEQNVRGFHDNIARLSAKLNPGNPIAERDRAMALVMGRFPNGTPLTVFDSEQPAPPFKNDFRFETHGGRCPFRGHIRRVNPIRGEVGTTTRDQHDRMIRIVRRGITYGRRVKGFGDRPSRDVGLLFMCYQSDIAGQFEHIQKEWCNWDHGLDLVVGQRDPAVQLPSEAEKRNSEWPKVWANSEDEKTEPLAKWPNQKVLKNFNFEQYVTLMGGEYFFAPSIGFLKKI